ncbi:MAG: M1 family aminopeptidase [Aeromicrobium sp.]
MSWMLRAVALTVLLALVPLAAQSQESPPAAAAAATQGSARSPYTPGAPGIGDSYYPLDGNGGYDVRHYLLDLRYQPDTDHLRGEATIRARATQNLSAFNLDFRGLTIRSIRVDDRTATWTRSGEELTVTPRRGLRKGARFTVEIRYAGTPAVIEDPQLGTSGFIHTDDGAVVAGQPKGASTWFPVNDHPLDKASYTFRVAAPRDLQVVANGHLEGRRTRHGLTTWVWEAPAPMASYLSTVAIGHFTTKSYRRNGIRFVDAIDSSLFVGPEPRTGSRYALSQVGDLTYKRLQRTITVPAAGNQVSFWVTRDTEAAWDFMFVEAHAVGSDTWTTLPDLNGHTSDSTGRVCPLSLQLHPFLAHYETANGDGTCSPTGTTGSWNAASGASDGYEQWAVDLSAYAGQDVEVSISYASDDSVQKTGLFVDDITVADGPGSTSFEDDGDTFDGWTVPGAPEGSAANTNDWIAGTTADAPPTVGENAAAALAREPDALTFLATIFGRYPFKDAGGIVDDVDLDFALETQTRPVYSPGFFGSAAEDNDSVVVHELAHQWVGDSLAVADWRHLWLNEGFGTYAEWLWSQDQGRATTQEIFDSWAAIPDDSSPTSDDGFWDLQVGDPGPTTLFQPVYERGALTLHALRGIVGDATFFKILRTWTRSRAGDNVTTPQFIALAERLSGRDLDAFFTEWLFTEGRPASLPPAAAAKSAAPTGLPPGLQKPTLRR